MGGSNIDDDWDLSEPSNESRTMVLVGRTGNGKSATGNSILGRKAFKSSSKSYGVTMTCEMQRAVLKNGQSLNVIDTPGLFDCTVGAAEEIVNCLRLAKDGFHAIIVVFSVRTRFSKEEEAAVRILQTFFGEKILDYMIVVFTGGDGLEEDDETLEDYLGQNCPELLQTVLRMCKNRSVLFDNRTKDEGKKAEQVQKLLELVNMVMAENGGQPFSDEFFVEMKEGAMKLLDQNEKVEALKGYSEKELSELKDNIYKTYEERLNGITEMVEQRLSEAMQRLEKQLQEETAARVKAEESALTAQMKSSDEIRKLKESLEKARKENEEFRKMAGTGSGRCAIL